MSELIVATGEQLVRLKPQNGRWHASKLPSGRGMQCLAADPRDPDVFDAGSCGEGSGRPRAAAGTGHVWSAPKPTCSRWR
jgi:hypothetical protein